MDVSGIETLDSGKPFPMKALDQGRILPTHAWSGFIPGHP